MAAVEHELAALADAAPERIADLGNGFERFVFTTPSVELYVAINGSGPLVSSNHRDYAVRTTFDHEVDDRLGRLVLPRSLRAQVHVFRRRTSAAA